MLQLECVFLIGRSYRPLPGAMELLQHLLGGGLSGIHDSVQRLEMTGLIASEVIDVAAPAQPRMRQRQAFLGDLEQVAIPDSGLEAEAWHIITQRLAFVRIPGFDDVPCGVETGIVIEQSNPKRR